MSIFQAMAINLLCAHSICSIRLRFDTADATETGNAIVNTSHTHSHTHTLIMIVILLVIVPGELVVVG